MKWREEEGGPVMAGMFHKKRAQVKFTGSRWRATVWTRKGTSSTTGLNLREAMNWCEEELRA
jgi:hypothetical protein